MLKLIDFKKYKTEKDSSDYSLQDGFFENLSIHKAKQFASWKYLWHENPEKRIIMLANGFDIFCKQSVPGFDKPVRAELGKNEALFYIGSNPKSINVKIDNNGLPNKNDDIKGEIWKRLENEI